VQFAHIYPFTIHFLLLKHTPNHQCLHITYSFLFISQWNIKMLYLYRILWQMELNWSAIKRNQWWNIRKERKSIKIVFPFNSFVTFSCFCCCFFVVAHFFQLQWKIDKIFAWNWNRVEKVTGVLGCIF
jgi:hypothetical protein